MTEEVNMAHDEFKSANEKTIEHLNNQLLRVRAGKATPSMLSSVVVDYYGSMTPLAQVANVSTLDARTITVQPWEKALLDECAKGIVMANLGLNPQSNGEMLILNVPALTEERRKDLVKKAKAEGEDSKVGIRNNRKDAMDFIKNLKNDGLSEDDAKVAEAKIQDMTNAYVKKIDELLEVKEKDIMTV